MAKYKAYPEYKDSGVEWLEMVPEGWICTQIKYGYDITLGKMLQKSKSSSKDELKPYLKAQNIQPTGIDISIVDNMWFSPDEKNKLMLKENDVLISEGGDVGRSVLWQGQIIECYIQNAINRARAIKHNSPAFLNYWMFYLKSADFINTLCNKATIAHYTVEKVETSPILLPNPDEQFNISLFLDHEIAKIDSLIEKQQQLIELLKEKRQAVISHAVTKGLNPDVPMKDSGVEWLGEVPVHWDICLLKYKCSVITDGAHISPDTNEGEHYFVSIKDIKKGIIDFNNSLLTSSASYKYLVKTGCKPFNGDILFSKDGTIGQTAIVPDDVDFVVASSLIIIRADKEKASPAFMDLLLQSSLVKEQVESFVKGTALRRLSIQNLEKVFGIFPTLSEQQIISDDIYTQLNRLDVLESKAVVQIQLLEERRTALISAAVTGKIDVRDWRAPDAQKTEEPQEATI
ncbi:restriction endonuclease subunit S [Cronobacter dublinensis]|uniref:restriction endonuclease subunit S n=1 Tax=Cronobacter dublinensis TaxID=413497 RepID=UPI00300E6180